MMSNPILVRDEVLTAGRVELVVMHGAPSVHELKLYLDLLQPRSVDVTNDVLFVPFAPIVLRIQLMFCSRLWCLDAFLNL